MKPKLHLRLHLRLPCVECREALVVPLPIADGVLQDVADDHGWHLSVLSPPGQGTSAPFVVGLLCPNCAQKCYTPELLKAAEKARHERMRS